jgi:hypothetical protein
MRGREEDLVYLAQVTRSELCIVLVAQERERGARSSGRLRERLLHRLDEAPARSAPACAA